MRLTSIVAALLGAMAFAQTPAGSDIKTYASSAEVTALIAKARHDIKPGQPIVAEPILQLAPYSAVLEYRTGAAPANVHEKQAEFFYIIEGSGTLVTGGKLINPTRFNTDNLTGTGIEGGDSRKVAKGDFAVVPENTPHWFNAVDGTLIMMSLHVPRPVAR